MVSPRSWLSTSGLIVGRPIKRAPLVDTPRFGTYNGLSPCACFHRREWRLPRDRICERFGTEAALARPEVDGFIGVGQVQALPGVVRQALRGERPAPLQGPSAGFEGYGLRIRSTPAWSAYVKVSEGCDRKCAFCVIPH